MKELKTHKNIRREVEIWGFKPLPFMIFLAVILFSGFGFLADASLNNAIYLLVANVISFVVTKIIMSNDSLTKSVRDEKFPKEITDLTKNGNAKN